MSWAFKVVCLIKRKRRPEGLFCGMYIASSVPRFIVLIISKVIIITYFSFHVATLIKKIIKKSVKSTVCPYPCASPCSRLEQAGYQHKLSVLDVMS